MHNLETQRDAHGIPGGLCQSNGEQVDGYERIHHGATRKEGPTAAATSVLKCGMWRLKNRRCAVAERKERIITQEKMTTN
mmetsp:Transcript_9240/g.22458  ORF Transcript_9240/g.22458 Transcript_9240/m.22458 type:complete len:80 (-) Transcript_9240:91-330(-)